MLTTELKQKTLKLLLSLRVEEVLNGVVRGHVDEGDDGVGAPTHNVCRLRKQRNQRNLIFGHDIGKVCISKRQESGRRRRPMRPSYRRNESARDDPNKLRMRLRYEPCHQGSRREGGGCVKVALVGQSYLADDCDRIAAQYVGTRS